MVISCFMFTCALKLFPFQKLPLRISYSFRFIQSRLTGSVWFSQPNPHVEDFHFEDWKYLCVTKSKVWYVYHNRKNTCCRFTTLLCFYVAYIYLTVSKYFQIWNRNSKQSHKIIYSWEVEIKFNKSTICLILNMNKSCVKHNSWLRHFRSDDVIMDIQNDVMT